MERDTVINVLLIIAGIVLALALFGAGALWRAGATKSPKSLSSAPSNFLVESGSGHPSA